MNDKLFDKWEFDVEVEDEGLRRYMNLDPIYVPHSNGRYQQKRFGKANLNIVERLINKLMRTGTANKKVGGRFLRRQGGYSGKKMKTYKTVKEAFEIINDKTDKNPLEILVKALQNAAPREETTTVSYGGVSYHMAVDMAPQRRLDFALRYIGLGASLKAFHSKQSFSEALAEEIILASSYDMKSTAVNKREEIERIAKSAR
ncbi:MAG: 30S ribosomal protein S7 [Euryarchaeota archaeon]|nr:30S ribosomal protein S7 [Euryarchaeota archaeon]